ncbi:hypothetical protein NSP_23310 [Nodularia spumigena CCY9414]|nr:hypothetical protein NSP_23310 [Nodularia spumigena CCY9414]
MSHRIGRNYRQMYMFHVLLCPETQKEIELEFQLILYGVNQK